MKFSVVYFKDGQLGESEYVSVADEQTAIAELKDICIQNNMTEPTILETKVVESVLVEKEGHPIKGYIVTGYVPTQYWILFDSEEEGLGPVLPVCSPTIESVKDCILMTFNHLTGCLAIPETAEKILNLLDQGIGVQIKTDGSFHPVQPKGKTFSLEEIQTYVGGYIEFVALMPPLGKRYQMYCNEEGKLKGLDANLIANSFYAGLEDDVLVGDVLFGPAVLFEGGSEEEEDKVLH